MTPAQQERFRQLLVALEQGVLQHPANEAARQELNELLRSDPQARDQYLDHAEMCALLRGQYSLPLEDGPELAAAAAVAEERAALDSAATPRSIADSLSNVQRRFYRWVSRPTPVAVSAAVVVLGLLLLVMAIVAPPVYRSMTARNGGETASRSIVARLVAVHEAEWGSGQIGTHVGAHLMTGHEMRLTSGLAEVAYANGATVILQGPCTFIVDDTSRGRLQQGKLTASVVAKAQGFAIATPQATIVDLGTEFGVEVADDGSTTASVFVGLVEMRRAGQDRSPGLRVAAGQMAVALAGEKDVELSQGLAEHLVREMPLAADSLEREITSTPDTVVWTGKGRNTNFFDESNWALGGETLPPGSLEAEKIIGRNLDMSRAKIRFPTSVKVFLGDGRRWRVVNSSLAGEFDTNFHPVSLGGGGSAAIELYGNTHFVYGWAWDIQWTLHDQSRMTALNDNPTKTGMLGQSSTVNFVGTRCSFVAPETEHERLLPENASKFKVNGRAGQFGSDPLKVEEGDNLVVEPTPDGKGSIVRPIAR